MYSGKIAVPPGGGGIRKIIIIIRLLMHGLRNQIFTLRRRVLYRVTDEKPLMLYLAYFLSGLNK
jgi:hypothetical protein